MKPVVVKILTAVAAALTLAAGGAGVASMVQASSYLDGMRAGRTTLLLSVVAQPLLDKPAATWTTTERKGMDLALKLALREGQASTSALEFAEDYVIRLGMSASTQETVHNLRCDAAKKEPFWTRVPRKLTQFVARNALDLPPCTKAAADE